VRDVVARGDQHHVPLDVALGGAIEDVERAATIDQRLRVAAAARSRRSLEGGYFVGECRSVVAEAGDPEPTAGGRHIITMEPIGTGIDAVPTDRRVIPLA
jgi:hypothetical protein